MTAARTILLSLALGLGAPLALGLGAAHADAIMDANNAVLAAKAGHYEDAIKLFSSAIYSDELNIDGRAQAFSYRGISKAATGDYDGGQADLDLAVALMSGYDFDAYAYRGYLELVRGEADKAAADLSKSAHLHIWPYNVLWLKLARMKAHLPDADDISLANNVAQLKLSAWPEPVMQFFLGMGTREEVERAAIDDDPQKSASQVCDADFYIAEFDLAHGDAAAKPGFMRAAEKCPFSSFERMGAAAELMRLNK